MADKLESILLVQGVKGINLRPNKPMAVLVTRLDPKTIEAVYKILGESVPKEGLTFDPWADA